MIKKLFNSFIRLNKLTNQVLVKFILITFYFMIIPLSFAIYKISGFSENKPGWKKVISKNDDFNSKY